MDKIKERDLDDVKEMLNLAKLNINDLKPITQTVYFTPTNFYENNYRLLEMDPHLLQEINEGSNLCFKGGKDEDVVLCSDSRTFNIVEVETSNSLLLANKAILSKNIENSPNHQIHKVEVAGIFHTYLEAKLGQPYLHTLETILNKSVYKGPEYEFETNKENLMSFEELCKNIRASNKEIQDALNTKHIVEVNGKIRLLDIQYHFRVLSYMLQLIEENSWELDEISFEETVNSLSDLAPRYVVSSLFEKYAEESKEVDGVFLYRYKENEICKFFAQVLLHGSGKFNCDEFLQAWKESVPEGMVPDEKVLQGIAIIDRKSNPNVIWAFDENTLPENINERFRILFETKEKWTVREIAPYIKRLTTEKLDVKALLAKYAHSSTIDGVKYYSSKHGK